MRATAPASLSYIPFPWTMKKYCADYCIFILTFNLCPADLFRIAKGTRKATVVATATVVAGSFGGADRRAVLSPDTGIEADGESETMDPAFSAGHPRFDSQAKSLSSLSKTGLWVFEIIAFRRNH